MVGPLLLPRESDLLSMRFEAALVRPDMFREVVGIHDRERSRGNSSSAAEHHRQMPEIGLQQARASALNRAVHGRQPGHSLEIGQVLARFRPRCEPRPRRDTKPVSSENGSCVIQTIPLLSPRDFSSLTQFQSICDVASEKTNYPA